MYVYIYAWIYIYIYVYNIIRWYIILIMYINIIWWWYDMIYKVLFVQNLNTAHITEMPFSISVSPNAHISFFLIFIQYPLSATEPQTLHRSRLWLPPLLWYVYSKTGPALTRVSKLASHRCLRESGSYTTNLNLNK